MQTKASATGMRVINYVLAPGMLTTGHFPNEDQKLDSLRPGSGEMERGR
jgi:hypothetical protein